VGQDFTDRTGFHDGRDRLEIAVALRAVLHVDGEDPGQEFGPADSMGSLGFLGLGRRACSVWIGLDFGRLLRNDLGADLGMRGKAAEITGQVDPGLGDNLSIIPSIGIKNSPGLTKIYKNA
jgi:hypothetical protein